MRRSSSTLVTPLSYCVFVVAVILIGLGIAEIALTAVSLRAFRRFQIQIPGSSLAEWKFVPMDPTNVDDGTTTAKFVVGTAGLVAALLALLWIALQWAGVGGIKIRKLGVMSCIATIVSTTCAVGFMIYVLVREGQNTLPDYFMEWQHETFTREYYVCAAFPAIFDNADDLYGFRACDIAQAAKFVMIAICCVSVILAGVVVLQTEKIGAFRSRELWDHEKGRPRKHAPKVHRSPKRREQPPMSTQQVVSMRAPPPVATRIAQPAATRYG